MRLALVNNSQHEPGFHDAWFGMIRPALEKALHPDTSVEFLSIRRGLSGSHALDFDNAYFDLLNKAAVGEVLIGAERDGFDAAMVACFADTAVHETRAVVQMPILGAGEATLLFACMLGQKLGVIATNMPEQIASVEDKLARMGLRDRVIPNGIRLDIHSFQETWERGLEDPQFVADGVERRARELVADGADVIVVGCCGLGPMCTLAGLSHIEVGSRRIPILDPVLIAMKSAEMSAGLRGAVGLPFSTTASVEASEVDRVHALFDRS